MKSYVLYPPRFTRAAKPAFLAALCLAMDYAQPQRLLADHTVTETATGTWEWVPQPLTGDDSAFIWGFIPQRYNPQGLPAETITFSNDANVTYTLQLVETPPSGDGWARQGAAPAAPQIRVTVSYSVDVRISPSTGDQAPSVSLAWSGLGGGNMTTSNTGRLEGSNDFSKDGPSYTATGDLTGQISLPPGYAGSVNVLSSFDYSFDTIGTTAGTSTYTRQVPGPHTPSSIPEPREWAMMAGIPLAAFACARRLRLRR